MSSGFHLQLLLFTVLGPAGALGFVLTSAFAITASSKAPWLFKLERFLLFPIFVCMLGLIIAATHLGTPRNALYVLLGAGRSPLSNEMVATIAFLAIAWLFWLVLATRKLPETASKVWLIIADIAALAMVFETSLAYSITTIPVWNAPVAPLMFWMGALVVSVPIALCTLRFAKVIAPNWSWKALLILQAFSVIGGIAAMLSFKADIAPLSSALTGTAGALGLVPTFDLYVAAFALFGIASVVVNGKAIQQALSSNQPTTPLPSPRFFVISLALALLAVIFMRAPFYLLYMTVGL